MTRDAVRSAVWTLIMLGPAVAVTLVLGHILFTRSPNAELARTTREALRMARDAHQDAEATRRASSALRVMALAAGVCGPLVAAYLIYRLRIRAEPESGEVLTVLEKERLLRSDRAKPPLKRSDAYRLLAKPGREKGESD